MTVTGAPQMVAPCAHQSPDLCVSWDYPMITVDGTECQIAGWCCECGALRVFATDNLDEERWLLPRKDCRQEGIHG